jgi:hypothetical protein
MYTSQCLTLTHMSHHLLVLPGYTIVDISLLKVWCGFLSQILVSLHEDNEKENVSANMQANLSER